MIPPSTTGWHTTHRYGGGTVAYYFNVNKDTVVATRVFILFYLYLARSASWEQVLIYNCDLAKNKAQQCDNNNNTELHVNKRSQ